MKDYMILINEESKPVLVEPVDGSEFKFYQFKDEAFAMELVRKLSNNENDFFGVGQTFPLPDNIIVSFEYLCNCQLQTLRGTPTMCFTCLRPGEHKLAILSKLEEHIHDYKYTESTVRQKCSCGKYKWEEEKVVAPSEEVKQGWISVKDLLPEIGEEVIVYSPRSNEGKGRVTALNRLIRYEGAVEFYWDNNYGGSNIYIQEAITHWMPLPKPPILE